MTLFMSLTITHAALNFSPSMVAMRMDDGERREPCATPCIDERVAEASAFLQDDSPHPEEWCGVYDILG
jgi:hypothetical protein